MILDLNKKIVFRGDSQSQKSLNDFVTRFGDVDEIWGDHAVFWDFDLTTKIRTLPLFFLNEIYNFYNVDFTDPEKIQTNLIFNFMINKKLDHRYLTARLVEYFDLKHFDYTFSGSAINVDDTRILKDIKIIDPERITFTSDLMMEILGDITLPPKFFLIENFSDIAKEHGAIGSFGGVREAWKSGIDTIFNSSFISLITESDNGDYDKVTIITEKTIFALIGLTVPIWPGGYRHAEGMQEMGFDVFADLIDHSYQHESTMFMRCFRAFKDNLDILKDLQNAKSIRQKIMPRLLQNREHLFSPRLIDWYQTRIKTWPCGSKPIRDFVLPYSNAYKHLNLAQQ
jgi:hypothetical protein